MAPGDWVTHRYHDPSLDGVEYWFSEKDADNLECICCRERLEHSIVGNHCPSELLVQLNILLV